MKLTITAGIGWYFLYKRITLAVIVLEVKIGTPQSDSLLCLLFKKKKLVKLAVFSDFLENQSKIVL